MHKVYQSETAQRLSLAMIWIEANPDHWEQSQWHCGTSHCFAGVCQLLMHGYDPKEYVINNAFNGSTHNSFIVRKDGFAMTWPDDDAISWLGITRKEGDVIFSEENSLEDLQGLVRNLCEHYG